MGLPGVVILPLPPHVVRANNQGIGLRFEGILANNFYKASFIVLLSGVVINDFS